MVDLKLARIPDQTPIKLTINVPPDLHQALTEYAALYAAAYGREEAPAALIPAIVAAFLQSDRSFVRSRGKQN